jgi:hypothetical protein
LGNAHTDEEKYHEYEKVSEEANNKTDFCPYIITLEQLEEKEHYDKLSISYYEDDDTLVDENEEVIADPVSIVGNDALNNFGEGSDDPEIVYVRNEKLETDYEVIRLSKSYAITVLGIEPEEGERRKIRRGVVDGE